MENKIGEARRLYSEEFGKFTQENAASYFGVSLSTYKKWEQGQGMMNGAQLRAIAAKYGVTVDYLLGMTEEPSTRPEAVTVDEAALLAMYRNMDATGRAALMEQAEFLAARHPLNQALGMGA